MDEKDFFELFCKYEEYFVNYVVFKVRVERIVCGVNSFEF